MKLYVNKQYLKAHYCSVTQKDRQHAFDQARQLANLAEELAQDVDRLESKSNVLAYVDSRQLTTVLFVFLVANMNEPIVGLGSSVARMLNPNESSAKKPPANPLKSLEKQVAKLQTALANRPTETLQKAYAAVLEARDEAERLRKDNQRLLDDIRQLKAELEKVVLIGRVTSRCQSNGRRHHRLAGRQCASFGRRRLPSKGPPARPR